MKKLILVLFGLLLASNAFGEDVPLGSTYTAKFLMTYSSTGAEVAADATPTCDVYEDNTSTPILVDGAMSLVTSTTNVYRIQLTVSSGNGYEAGKWYNQVCKATVGSLLQNIPNDHFRVVATENLAGKSVVDLVDIDGLATNGNNATLFLKSLDVRNSGGSGIVGVSTGGAGNGIVGIGQGSAGGIQGTGGATGPGIAGIGGASGGAGLYGAASSGNTAAMTLIPSGTGKPIDDLFGEVFAELAQGTPTATPSLRTALMALYMALRNQVLVTNTLKSFTNDAGTVIYKKTLADNGTTFTESEAVSGP